MLTAGLKTPPWWVRWTIAIPAMFVAGYSVVVLWYVATSPDLGYRVLLADAEGSFFPFEMPEDGVQVAVYGESRRSGVVLQESPDPNYFLNLKN